MMLLFELEAFKAGSKSTHLLSVNLDRVTRMEPYDETSTTIYFAKDHFIVASESYDDLKQRIKDAYKIK